MGQSTVPRQRCEVVQKGDVQLSRCSDAKHLSINLGSRLGVHALAVFVGGLASVLLEELDELQSIAAVYNLGYLV